MQCSQNMTTVSGKLVLVILIVVVATATTTFGLLHSHPAQKCCCVDMASLCCAVLVVELIVAAHNVLNGRNKFMQFVLLRCSLVLLLLRRPLSPVAPTAEQPSILFDKL